MTSLPFLDRLATPGLKLAMTGSPKYPPINHIQL